MIDDGLLNTYVAELEALRTHARDLAKAYPDIASRLDIGPRRSRDPQVERVIEAAAFLAARLRLLIEHHAAELPMALLSLIAPALTEPVPAMGLIRFTGGSEALTVPRGARFDYWSERQPLLCFSTTMEIELSPARLQVRRLPSTAQHPDGLALRVSGQTPNRLVLYLGNDELSAAALLDGLADALAGIEIIPPGGGPPVPLPRERIRWHGFSDAEAALPLRPAAHRAHRLVTEALSYPSKFRFVSLSDPAIVNGCELRFRFTRPLGLPEVVADDLVGINCVPMVNLWNAPATPVDVTGTRIEYPVRVDTQRFRLVECHSVEAVDLYGPSDANAVRLDPMVSFGNLRGSDIRWGIRRAVSRTGSEVYIYFRGLDYRMLGQHRFLAAPQVYASNADLPQTTRVGSILHPADSFGDWQSRLASVPTRYVPAVVDSGALRTLLSYVQSGMRGFVSLGRPELLRDYLRSFPGGEQAPWIDGLRSLTVRPSVSMRSGYAQPATAVALGYDPSRSRTTSRALVRRLLTELFESQRGLNQIEEFVVSAA